jgi:hypothetical protein
MILDVYQVYGHRTPRVSLLKLMLFRVLVPEQTVANESHLDEDIHSLNFSLGIINMFKCRMR